jgi:hypothetical protein
LDQLLLGLVRDLLHRLLKYLKARHVQDQFDNRLISVLWYPGLQHFFKPYDWTKTSPWQGVEIQDMIRTQAVHWALILNCFKDDRRPPAKTASIEMVLEEVRALCEWSLLDSQQDQTDLSLTAVDDTMNTFSKNKGAFRDQKMLKSAKTKVNKQLARHSRQLREQKIHKIHGAMEVLGHRAKKVTTSKRWEFEVGLTRARQAGSKCSVANRMSAIECLEREIHSITCAKCNVFPKLIHHHERQLL